MQRSSPPSILSILGENTLAMTLQLPHLILPGHSIRLIFENHTCTDSMLVGQIAYDSRGSQRTEYKPLSVGLIGAKGINNTSLTCFCRSHGLWRHLGSDLMLAKLAKEAFESSGWPTRVQTGRMTFPLNGGNDLKLTRDDSAIPKRHGVMSSMTFR